MRTAKHRRGAVQVVIVWQAAPVITAAKFPLTIVVMATSVSAGAAARTCALNSVRAYKSVASTLIVAQAAAHSDTVRKWCVKGKS